MTSVLQAILLLLANPLSPPAMPAHLPSTTPSKGKVTKIFHLQKKGHHKFLKLKNRPSYGMPVTNIPEYPLWAWSVPAQKRDSTTSRLKPSLGRGGGEEDSLYYTWY